jgi:hypothetical protein
MCYKSALMRSRCPAELGLIFDLALVFQFPSLDISLLQWNFAKKLERELKRVMLKEMDGSLDACSVFVLSPAAFHLFNSMPCCRLCRHIGCQPRSIQAKISISLTRDHSAA